MEARFSTRRVLVAAKIFHLVFLTMVSSALAQYPTARQRSHSQSFRVTTEHFVVTAVDQQLAHKVGKEAERFRKELAQQWLGHELGPWRDKCPITVELGMHAGGETSFAFMVDERGQGVPVNWQMKIFGPPDRLLDAVLPHEITHTIFATHFGRPLPRWADEGACTTVEHESERRKNHQMLMDFLNARPSRGIPFNRMFTMREYPHDILPLYAQGYSLAKFLISQKGRRHFLDYVAAGMHAETSGHELTAWNRVTDKYYGYEDLSKLQIEWLRWVKDGSDVATLVAQRDQPASLASPTADIPETFVSANTSSQPTRNTSNETRTASARDAASWYHRQMQAGQNRFASNRQSISPESQRESSSNVEKSSRSLPVNSDTLWR